MSDIILEALRELRNQEPMTEELNQEITIPAPYDRYYEIVKYDPEEGEYQIGDEIEGYNTHVVAYLALKPEHSETKLQSDAFLVDDPDYPVCYVVGGRMYPIEIPEELTEGADADLFADEVTKYGYSESWEDKVLNPVLDKHENWENEGGDTGDEAYILITDDKGRQAELLYETDNLCHLDGAELESLIVKRLEA